MNKESQKRWESFNELVDDVLPQLTNAEGMLLMYYFRHAKVKGASHSRRNIFRVADGRAAKDLQKSRQTIRYHRQSLMQKSVISHVVISEHRSIWMIGTPPTGTHSGYVKVT